MAIEERGGLLDHLLVDKLHQEHTLEVVFHREYQPVRCFWRDVTRSLTLPDSGAELHASQTENRE